MNPSITGTSGPISVSALNAMHFLVTAPANATAGTPITFTVTALDVNNNVAFTYPGTVHFTSSDANAMLPADMTLTNGMGTFSATLKTAGSQTITATDTVTPAVTGTSGPINVAVAGLDHFNVLAPGSSTGSVPFNFTVTAVDAFNNTITNYGGVIHFTTTDPAGVLPADSMLTNGVGTFSATLKTMGNQTITATDTVNSAITGTSNPIAITNLPVTHYLVTAPATATAGTPINFTVTALDANNNVSLSYPGTVHFTSTDAAAVLPPNVTLTQRDGHVPGNAQDRR